MPLEAIYSTQLAIMMLFLNQMGYHQHFPWAVVYALATVGGLDFWHLGYEQGVQQVLQLTKHLHSQTTNGKLYSSLTNAYQIHVGVSLHVLMDTTPRPWCPKGWLTSI